MAAFLWGRVPPGWRAGILLVAVAACGGEADALGGGGGGPPPIPVEVVVARIDTVVDAIAATGQVEAVQAIALQPDVSGRVTAILVREGASVGEGTPLVRIDDAPLRAQVARAEADRDLAAQALARSRELLKLDGISREELERAEATARSTQAALDLLAIQLDRTVVRAPFTGVVGERRISLGDMVTPATPLMTLQTVDPQRAAFSVPERFADQVAEGQEVAFRVAALPGRTWRGRVDFVSPAIDPSSRTVLIKARVPNPGRDLQAGMFLELRLATETRPEAVVIPEDAVVPLDLGTYVWVVTNGQAERREVTLGVRTPGFVEARSGIAAGDQVVVAGQVRLQPGAPVSATVVERTQPRPARDEVDNP